MNVNDDALRSGAGRLVPSVLCAILAFAAQPSAASANEGSAEDVVAEPATTPSAAAPWWGGPVEVKPKPWLMGTLQEPWRFIAAGYLWLPNAPAKINLGHGDISLPENLPVILESLQFGLMLDFEVRKGRYGGYFAPIFLWLRDDDNTVQGPIEPHQLIISESVYLIDFGASYELGQWSLWNRPNWVIPSPAVTIEPIFGARSLVDNITIALNPGGDVTPKVSFIAPVIGLQTLWDITDRFNVRINGDYGGFGVDKLESTYNFVAVGAYRFKPRNNLGINLFVGYRYLYINYVSTATLEVTLKGAFLGAAFEFGHD